MLDWALASLFISAFVSATVAPGGSEAVLLYWAAQGQHHWALLLGVASFGNTLGALTTWGMGYAAARGWWKRHTPPAAESLQRFKRYGMPLLLLSWLLVVGDGFCFAAGWLRLPWLPGLIAIAVGKTARYAALLYGLN